jgi:hypothetical protein
MPTNPTPAARITANKANAQKSTGPRTTDGKARVSQNAFKHGLRSERNPLELAGDATLPAEREEFLTTLAAFRDDLHAHGPIETALVERLAQINLRLNRAVRVETAHLKLQATLTLNEITAGTSAEIGPNDLAMLSFLRDPAALTLIGRYESRLSRDFRATLAELRRAQKLRNQSQSGIAATDPCPASNGRVANDDSAEQSQSAIPDATETTTISELRLQGSGASGHTASSEGSMRNPANQTHRCPEASSAATSPRPAA